MAYTGILCTEDEVTNKEGAGVSADVDEAMHNLNVAQAEGFVNSASRQNWNTLYSGLTAAKATILNETVSSLAAIKGIEYDMSGYSSRSEAEGMITTLRDEALRNVQLLRDIKVQTFMKEA